jgi:ABC-2 type transport system permease protein
MDRRRVKGLIVKEILQAKRDPSSLIIALIFPLILLFLYGYGVSLDMNGIKLAVVAEDKSSLARSFVRSLTATPYLHCQMENNRKLAEALLTAGDVDGMVIIPSYFSTYYHNSDETAPIQVIADGSQPNTAQFVQNYVRGVWFKWQEKLFLENASSSKALISVTPRVWYNQELYSVYFLIPGAIAVIMTVTGALLTSLVVAREWERGTMEALLSTRVTMGEIILSKLITYFMLGIGALLVCYFFARCIYGIPFRGSYFALIASALSYLMLTLGMGLWISITVRDQFAASQIAIVVTYLPAFILSGFIFDIASMPSHLRMLTRFVPARYFVDNLKTIFLVGDIWPVILPNILYMNSFSLIVFSLISRKCIKRLD